MISVIICTFNRCESLASTLESFTRIKTRSDFTWELIVVDNNSVDTTKRVVSEFNSRLPIRYFFESKQGLSHARNCGIAQAQGDIIVFTDDDVIVTNNWLHEITNGLNAFSDVDLLFGRTLMHSAEQYALSTKDSEEQEIFEHPSYPWAVGNGNNMAIRHSLFSRIGLFDVNFGAGSKISSSEDSDFVYRALKSGCKILYYPLCLVYHNHDRVTPLEISKIIYNYAIGRGAFYLKFMMCFDPWVTRLFSRELKRLFRRLIHSPKDYKYIFMNIRGLGYGMILWLNLRLR